MVDVSPCIMSSYKYIQKAVNYYTCLFNWKGYFHLGFLPLILSLQNHCPELGHLPTYFIKVRLAWKFQMFSLSWWEAGSVSNNRNVGKYCGGNWVSSLTITSRIILSFWMAGTHGWWTHLREGENVTALGSRSFLWRTLCIKPWPKPKKHLSWSQHSPLNMLSFSQND